MITTTTNVSTTAVSIERKTQILRVTLGITVLSFIVFLITLTSSNWIVISYPANFTAKRQKMFVTRSTYGIIFECIVGKPTIHSAYGKYESIICIFQCRTS